MKTCVFQTSSLGQATTGFSQLPMRTKCILVNYLLTIKGQSVVVITETGADDDDFGLQFFLSKLQF